MPMFSFTWRNAWKLRRTQYHTRSEPHPQVCERTSFSSLHRHMSGHLLTTEWSWVLHPWFNTHPENKILHSIIKSPVFLEECLLTAVQLLRRWNCCLSHWCYLAVCLDSDRQLCHQRWYGNGDSSHGRSHALMPCLYSTSHNTHGLQLEPLTTHHMLNA